MCTKDSMEDMHTDIRVLKGLILCSLNNLKPENTPDHFTEHNTVVGITFYRGRGFQWLVFFQNVSLYQVVFFQITKFCPFSGLKGPVIHMRSNSNWFYASRRSCIFSLRGLFSLNNCLSELNYGPLNAVHKNWCADNILNFLNLAAYLNS